MLTANDAEYLSGAIASDQGDHLISELRVFSRLMVNTVPPATRPIAVSHMAVIQQYQATLTETNEWAEGTSQLGLDLVPPQVIQAGLCSPMDIPEERRRSLMGDREPNKVPAERQREGVKRHSGISGLEALCENCDRLRSQHDISTLDLEKLELLILAQLYVRSSDL